MKNNLLTTDEILELTIEESSSNSDRELIPVFNEEGVQLGVAPRLLCHRLGLIHKVVYAIIINEENKILLQVRGDRKKGRLDVPVGGHVSIEDKSNEDAIQREMLEELGMYVEKDQFKLFDVYYRIREFNIKKPIEVNREIRYLYLYEMSKEKEKELNEKFSNRAEQQAVVDFKWMDINKVLEYCDTSMVADGLGASLIHFAVKYQNLISGFENSILL